MTMAAVKTKRIVAVGPNDELNLRSTLEKVRALCNEPVLQICTSAVAAPGFALLQDETRRPPPVKLLFDIEFRAAITPANQMHRSVFSFRRLAGDHYLGRSRAVTGRVREGGIPRARDDSSEVRGDARPVDDGPPSARNIQTIPKQTRASCGCGQDRHQQTQCQAH